jgi:hypothetical protein
VINISNFTSENKSPWWQARPVQPAQPTQPARPAAAGSRGEVAGRPRARSLRARTGNVLVIIAGGLAIWLAYIPRRLGDRLFAMHDNEAYWRGWQITKVHGGLGRRYRDPLFDTLAECAKCHGAAGTSRRPGISSAPPAGPATSAWS